MAKIREIDLGENLVRSHTGPHGQEVFKIENKANQELGISQTWEVFDDAARFLTTFPEKVRLQNSDPEQTFERQLLLASYTGGYQEFVVFPGRNGLVQVVQKEALMTEDSRPLNILFTDQIINNIFGRGAWGLARYEGDNLSGLRLSPLKWLSTEHQWGITGNLAEDVPTLLRAVEESGKEEKESLKLQNAEFLEISLSDLGLSPKSRVIGRVEEAAEKITRMFMSGYFPEGLQVDECIDLLDEIGWRDTLNCEILGKVGKRKRPEREFILDQGPLLSYKDKRADEFMWGDGNYARRDVNTKELLKRAISTNLTDLFLVGSRSGSREIYFRDITLAEASWADVEKRDQPLVPLIGLRGFPTENEGQIEVNTGRERYPFSIKSLADEYRIDQVEGQLVVIQSLLGRERRRLGTRLVVPNQVIRDLMIDPDADFRKNP